MNFINAQINEKDGRQYIANSFLSREVKTKHYEHSVTIGIRPERIRVSFSGQTAKNVKTKLVRKYITCGGQYLLLADIEGKRIKIKTDTATGREVAGDFYLSLSDQDVLVYDNQDKLAAI